MGERTDRDIIDSGGGALANALQCHAAARLKFYFVFPKRNRFAELGWLHIIEQDQINLVDLEEGARLLQTVRLDFDAQIRPFSTKFANRFDKCGESGMRREVVIFYQHHIE